MYFTILIHFRLLLVGQTNKKCIHVPAIKLKKAQWWQFTSPSMRGVIGRPDKQEVHTCTSNQIEEGTMVAVYLAKYVGEWPQIGNVTETNTD